MKNLIINFLLLVVATLLFFPMTIVNLFVVLFSDFKFKKIFKKLSGYFLSSAINIDKFANHEFRTLWNLVFIKKDALVYHKFGVFEETISYALARNKELESNSKFAKIVEKILDFFDKDHLEKTRRLYELKNKQIT